MELRKAGEELGESSCNNLVKEHSPGQENRPATYNVMPSLPAARPKPDYSKISASQAATLLQSCRQEVQQGRHDIQRQVPLVSMQDLASRTLDRSSLNRAEVTNTWPILI